MPNSLRYVGPFDAVDVVGVGVVEHGGEFTPFSDEHEASLLEQTDNFVPADAADDNQPGVAGDEEEE